MRVNKSILVGSFFSLLYLITGCALGPTPSRFKEKTCIDCHQDKLSELKKGNVHDPVEKDQCKLCHRPHGIIGAAYLKKEGNLICFDCHERETLVDKHLHSVLKKGKCIDCHKPHSSPHSFLLKEEGNNLCYSCHKDEKFSRRKVHQPAGKNCITCHDPHSSPNTWQLVSSEEKICLKCHKIEKREFVSAHSSYPVEGKTCSTCHTPHSSSNDQLFRENVHSPLESKKCGSCHNPADSQKPLGVKNAGSKLCYTCHDKDKFKDLYSHSPVEDGD